MAPLTLLWKKTDNGQNRADHPSFFVSVQSKKGVENLRYSSKWVLPTEGE